MQNNNILDEALMAQEKADSKYKLQEPIKCWNRDIAILLINQIRQGLANHNYYPALAGSILYKGWSEKDLDIILYAEHCHEDYRCALDYLIGELHMNNFKAVEFPGAQAQSDHKLVFEGYVSVVKPGYDFIGKINIFIPGFSVAGKLDSYEVVTKELNRSQGIILCQ